MNTYQSQTLMNWSSIYDKIEQLKGVIIVKRNILRYMEIQHKRMDPKADKGTHGTTSTNSKIELRD